MKNKEELYAALVVEAEDYKAKKGHRPSRFEMLYVLDGFGVKLCRDAIDLVEKLYADGFANA